MWIIWHHQVSMNWYQYIITEKNLKETKDEVITMF